MCPTCATYPPQPSILESPFYILTGRSVTATGAILYLLHDPQMDLRFSATMSGRNALSVPIWPLTFTSIILACVS